MKTTNTFSKECQDELKKQLPIIYKNQFRNHKVISINYNGLLTDLKTYWNQEARFREGFAYTDTTVTIPNFFTKINGVPLNVIQAKSYKVKKKLFSEEFDFLINQKLTKVITNCNICYEANSDIYKNVANSEYFKILFEDFYISSENYLTIIENLALKEQLDLSKTILNLYFDKLTEFFTDIKEELDLVEKVTLLKNLIVMNPSLAKLINMVDYGFEVPKIVIFDENNKLGKISAYAYYFLNYLGFDICFFSPSGKINIEKYFEVNDFNYGYFEEDLSFLSPKKKPKIKKGFIIFDFLSDIFSFAFFDMTLILILLICLSIIFRKNLITLIILIAFNIVYALVKVIWIDVDCNDVFGEDFDNIVETKLKKPHVYVKILISLLWGYVLILGGMICSIIF